MGALLGDQTTPGLIGDETRSSGGGALVSGAVISRLVRGRYPYAVTLAVFVSFFLSFYLAC